MSVVISQLTIDSADPLTLARWWADALGWAFVETDEDDGETFVAPERGSTPGLLFVPVSDGKTVKNRLHLDLRPADGSDQGTQLRRLLDLGATPVDVGQQDASWHVLADPEGNEFCLLSRTPAEVAADQD